jgi:predicted RNase H-like HicB family nuclease
MKEYVVIYEWTGRNYSAYAPDLPGCVAAGDTLEETERLMKEAIELYIESLKEIGQLVPEPTTKAKPVAVMA